MKKLIGLLVILTVLTSCFALPVFSAEASVSADEIGKTSNDKEFGYTDYIKAYPDLSFGAEFTLTNKDVVYPASPDKEGVTVNDNGYAQWRFNTQKG